MEVSVKFTRQAVIVKQNVVFYSTYISLYFNQVIIVSYCLIFIALWSWAGGAVPLDFHTWYKYTM